MKEELTQEEIDLISTLKSPNEEKGFEAENNLFEVLDE